MRITILYLIIAVISANCMGQNKPITLNLQQIELKDKILTKTLSDLSIKERDCFNKNDFYILDFFHSSLSKEEYYLSIDRFVANNTATKSIAYYLIINDIVYFVSNKVSVDVIEILPSKKEYSFKNEKISIIGGDYHFLIWRTLSGYYHVLLRTCSE